METIQHPFADPYIVVDSDNILRASRNTWLGSYATSSTTTTVDSTSNTEWETWTSNESRTLRVYVLNSINQDVMMTTTTTTTEPQATNSWHVSMSWERHSLGKESFGD
jgi:CTP:phosphocholine cytidylyltransferase-like protein